MRLQYLTADVHGVYICCCNIHSPVLTGGCNSLTELENILARLCEVFMFFSHDYQVLEASAPSL